MGAAGPSEGPFDHDAEVERLVREVSVLLRRSRSVLRAVAGRIHPDVDDGAYAVLLVIAQAGPLRLVDLAEEVGLDKSTMSRQVSTLARLGLVERRPDPVDGRAHLLETSADGERRLTDLARDRQQAWRTQLQSWSTEDVATLADGLARLGASFPAASRPPV